MRQHPGLLRQPSGAALDVTGSVALSLHDAERTQWRGAGASISEALAALAPAVHDTLAYLKTTAGTYGRPVRHERDGWPLPLDVEVTAGGYSGHALWHAAAPELETQEVAQTPVFGKAYFPTQSAPVGVVTLPGSGGGIDALFAPALAGIGYPSLAAALFRYPGRPDYHARIALEDIVAAANWLRSAAKVEKIVILGSSRGSEAAMLAARYFPDVFQGCVALVPGNVVTAGWTAEAPDAIAPWTAKGRDLPWGGQHQLHVPPPHGDEAYACTPLYRAIFEDQAAIEHAGIAVKNIVAPMMFVGADDDQMWPSGFAARALAQTRKRSDDVCLILDEAGHFLTPPGIPIALADKVWHPVEQRFYAAGGNPASAYHAQMTLWAGLQVFLAKLS